MMNEQLKEYEVIVQCRKEGSIGVFDRVKSYYPLAKSRHEAIMKAFDYLHALDFEPHHTISCKVYDFELDNSAE